MINSNTLVIEMTGIMGAGFLPGLHKALAEELRNKHEIVGQTGNSRPLISRFFTDNEAARKSNIWRRKRMVEILTKIPKITAEEANELTESLKWTEDLFVEDLNSFNRPIDIVFRRGGRLQSYILLNGINWNETEVYNSGLEPKMQIFLRAPLEAIKQTFELNTEFIQAFNREPGVYCATPERAFELQEEWFSRVRNFKGLTSIERVQANLETNARDEFVSKIIHTVVPHFKLFGFTTKEHMLNQSENNKENRPKKAFISYKWENDIHNCWVETFAADLRKLGIETILDRWEVRFGDSFTEYMTSKIQEADVFLFIMTSASVQAVEAVKGRGGAVQFEVQMAMARKVAGEARLIPIYREGIRPVNYLRDHRYVDFRDNKQYELRLKELVDDIVGVNVAPVVLSKGRITYVNDQLIVNKPIDTLELQNFIYMAYREFNLGETFLLAPNINNIEMKSHAFTPNGYFNYLIENTISQYSFKFFQHTNRNRYLIVNVDNDKPECRIELHLEAEDNKEIKNDFLKQFTN